MKKNLTEKTILVTGSTGFIGTCLIEELSKKYPNKRIIGLYNTTKPVVFRKNVTYLMCDLLDREYLTSIVIKYKPEIIYHLAGMAIIPECAKNPTKAFRVNVEGTAGLLEVLYQSNINIRKILLVSSYKVFKGSKNKRVHEKSEVLASDIYTATMLAKEEVGRVYKTLYNLPITITRLAHVYGPSIKHESRLIPNVILSIKNGTPPKVFTNSASAKLTFVYTTDVVHALMYIALLKISPFIVCIGGETSVTIKKVVKTILTLMKSNLKIKEITSTLPKEPSRDLSIRTIESLGWKPKISFEKGLATMINQLTA